MEETPEQAFARRQEQLAEQEFEKPQSFLSQEKRPWAHKSHLTDETRPGFKQRFPSRDIWEDTPDSLQLQTTVDTPQSERDILSPPDDRPTTGAVTFYQEKAAAGLPLGSEEGRATTGLAATTKPPQIPARPSRAKPADSGEKQQAGVPVPEGPGPSQLQQVDGPSPPLLLPVKSKPQVPARPSKPIMRESSEGSPLTQVTSNSSAKSVGSDQGTTVAAAVKPKPPVPSRPIGTKIAALQGGFMSDLNKRLQLGRQAPPTKKEELALEEPEVVEQEKAPLADARKGRPRGPARRAPARTLAPVNNNDLAAASTPTTLGLGFGTTSTIWHIDPEEDMLHVASDEKDSTPSYTKTTQSETPPTPATNTADEDLHEACEKTIAPSTDKSASPPPATEDAPIEESQEAQTTEESSPTGAPEDELELEPEPVKDASDDEPQVVSQATSAPEAAEEEDLSESTGTLKASGDAEEEEDVVE
jgi:hypothetical protein